jgi:hypothetical protein
MIQIESTHGHEANRLTKQFAQAHPVKNMKSVDHFACHAWKLQVLQPQNKHSLRIATVFVSSDNIMGFNIHIYIYMHNFDKHPYYLSYIHISCFLEVWQDRKKQPSQLSAFNCRWQLPWRHNCHDHNHSPILAQSTWVGVKPRQDPNKLMWFCLFDDRCCDPNSPNELLSPTRK